MQKFTKIFAFMVFMSFVFNSFAQLQPISTTSNAQIASMVQNILKGNGVSISNVSYTGSLSAISSFNTGSSPTNLGFSNGILIATGNTTNAVGPNNATGTGNAFNLPGDTLLTQICGSPTFDAAVLEFDFVPQFSNILLTYVFASEEYDDYVNSSVNDVFALIVNGANPQGGNYLDSNFAVIPGTYLPVSINNVNNGNCSYNQTPSGPCENCQYYVNNNGNPYLQYDGKTTVLTAILDVVPGSTYHLKIGIADAGDGIFDSGLFIKANSFSNVGYSSYINSSLLFTGSNLICEEGKNIVSINANISQTMLNDFVFKVDTFWGSASNGVDFSFIPDSLVIPAGQTSVNYLISPIEDNLPEGIEDFYIVFETNFAKRDTISFKIKDSDVGIQNSEKEEINFELFPNPATSVLNIDFFESSVPKQICIYDVLGNLVFSSFSSQSKEIIEISNLDSGVYSVLIVSGNSSKRKIFVKK